MTHDERIEACLDALTNYIDDPDGGYPSDYLRKAVIDILAAAGIEDMVREAADKGYEEGFQCLEYDMQAESDAVEAIVREVMGK